MITVNCDNTERTYTANIGTLLKGSQGKTFIGKIGDIEGLFLIFRKGIISLNNPELMWYLKQIIVKIDYWVDIKITTTRREEI